MEWIIYKFKPTAIMLSRFGWKWRGYKSRGAARQAIRDLNRGAKQ